MEISRPIWVMDLGHGQKKHEEKGAHAKLWENENFASMIFHEWNVYIFTFEVKSLMTM